MALKLSAEDFANECNNAQNKSGGSLCFYGHWFGRPMDNYHELESAAFDRSINILTLTFSQKGTLTISNPQGISVSGGTLTITSADKIYWRWFFQDKPATEENALFIEIIRQGNSLAGNSNIRQDFKDLNIINPALSMV